MLAALWCFPEPPGTQADSPATRGTGAPGVLEAEGGWESAHSPPPTPTPQLPGDAHAACWLMGETRYGAHGLPVLPALKRLCSPEREQGLCAQGLGPVGTAVWGHKSRCCHSGRGQGPWDGMGRGVWGPGVRACLLGNELPVACFVCKQVSLPQQKRDAFDMGTEAWDSARNSMCCRSGLWSSLSCWLEAHLARAKEGSPGPSQLVKVTCGGKHHPPARGPGMEGGGWSTWSGSRDQASTKLGEPSPQCPAQPTCSPVEQLSGYGAHFWVSISLFFPAVSSGSGWWSRPSQPQVASPEKPFLPLRSPGLRCYRRRE